MRRTIMLAAAGLSTAVIVVATPGADAKRVSYMGSCAFEGTVTFSPGLKSNDTEQDQAVDFSGPCDGGDGRLTGSVKGVAGCTGAQDPASGRGVLTVGGKTIKVKMVLDAKLPNGQLTIQGLRSGEGSGIVRFLNGGNLGQMGNCVGEGLKEISATSDLTVTKTLVTGKKKKKKKRG